MTKMSPVKQATITAACMALCCVLPMAFHSLSLGSAFSPMHIPVLLCGLICGGWYGCFCGIAGPVLSSVLTGMPGATGLIFMVPELAVYGLVSGLVMRLVRTRSLCADLYIALITAMLLGRVAGGIASAIFYMGNGETFSIALWAASNCAGTVPGIIAHLILLPVMVIMLMKARLIPNRY